MSRPGPTTLAIASLLVAALVFLGELGDAAAQAFPPDDEWAPLYCGAAPMRDGVQDESGAVDDRDLVGDPSDPAGMHASDTQFLFLRLRLDKDPAPGGMLAPFAWGMQIDLDGDVSTYELLLLVDGTGGGSGAVRLYRNTMTTTPNDSADPADMPQVAMFALPFHARSRVAPGSSFAGDPDFFLEFAVPWAQLEPLGLGHDTLIFVWAASSSTTARLDGDFACHDGATGEPALDDVASDQTVGDPAVDSDGDGFSDAEELAGGSDANDPNSTPARRLEGGGGCGIATRNDAAPITLVALLVLGLICRASRSTACRSRR